MYICEMYPYKLFLLRRYIFSILFYFHFQKIFAKINFVFKKLTTLKTLFFKSKDLFKICYSYFMGKCFKTIYNSI